MIKENLSLYFRHFAIDAYLGHEVCKVIFHASDTFVDKEAARIKDYNVTAVKQAKDLPSLKVKDILTIENIDYRVSEIERISDGVLHRIYLNPVR